MGISVCGLTVEVGHVNIITNVSLEIAPGELVGIIGPNGTGKTTLLRAIMGIIPGKTGTVTLDGESVHALRPEQRAKKIAYLPQSRQLAWPQKVRDIIALGRFAYGSSVSERLSPQDGAAIARALDDTGLTPLANRRADTLSGGETARMHIARALATEARYLIADEPATSLDPYHQHKVMRLFRNFATNGGGALCTIHDLTLAAQYADRLLWVHDGRIVADGTPKETLTTARIKSVFNVDCEVRHQPTLDVSVIGPALEKHANKE